MIYINLQRNYEFILLCSYSSQTIKDTQSNCLATVAFVIFFYKIMNHNSSFPVQFYISKYMGFPGFTSWACALH